MATNTHHLLQRYNVWLSQRCGSVVCMLYIGYQTNVVLTLKNLNIHNVETTLVSTLKKAILQPTPTIKYNVHTFMKYILIFKSIYTMLQQQK